MPHRRIYQAVQQAQQSLQQIHEGLQQLTNMGMGQQGGGMQFGGFAGGPQSVMQPGFAGTDAQQVRQDIQNSSNNVSMGMMGMGQPGGSMQYGGFVGGPQSNMQPGFAGTDAQQVRQDIQNSSMGGGVGQQGVSFNQMGLSQPGGSMQFGSFGGGAQSVMQPGFAGTDAQQVRQDIQNSSNGQITSRNAGSMGANTMGQQSGSFNQMGMSQPGGSMQVGGFAGGQSIMQPGFAGTDAQQVRQDISNNSGQGYMQ